MKKTFTYILIIAATVCLTIGIYIGCLSWQTYQFLKQPGTFSYGVFENDTLLGYRLVAGSSGRQFIPDRPALPLAVDAHGCRQREHPPVVSDSLGMILFLGDSYTFGDGVACDSTFASLTGDATGHAIFNASCGGYGLPQFLLQAVRYLPLCQPRAVVFQYSPWSGPRSVLAYVNRMIEKTPAPYFSRPGGAITGIARPYYQSEIFRITGEGVFERYRKSAKSALDFCGFYREYGLAVFLPQIKNESILLARKMAGAVPPKATDLTEIESYYLSRIAALGEQYQSRVILLLIGMDANQSRAFRMAHASYIARHPGIALVDADSVMRAHLTVPTLESFEREYMIWGGSPPYIVDRHYNEKAQLLIARALAEEIR